MKIGLIGNGGREHAIAIGLCKNPDTQLIVAAQGKNHAIMQLSADYRETGFEHARDIVDYFVEQGVEWVVVGPEATLMLGVVDRLRAVGIPCVGPTQAQAQLEGDKSFMRHLLRDELGWGSPAWASVSSKSEAIVFMKQVGAIVVKPLGLTGGKGVRVMGIQLRDEGEALDYIVHLLETDGEVLLEECVIGEEFSRMAFVSDGEIAFVPLMQDFKYAYDDDLGLMTGGMGAYSYADGGLPFVEEGELAQADQLLVEVVQALEKQTGERYRGFLYGQFMVTKADVKLIEFNVRLGDPEALNLMAILDSDAAEVFSRIATGRLEPKVVQFKDAASVVKYLVPTVYPDPIKEPVSFSMDEAKIHQAGLMLIHGSVEQKDPSQWLALGSRTIGLVGLGERPGVIAEKMHALIDTMHIPELRYRKDVGNDAVIREKTQKMQEIRDGR